MKANSLRVLFRASSKKFYEIVAEKQNRLLPDTPEELIISKYLKQDRVTLTPINKVAKPQPSKATISKAVNYQQIMENHPQGSIVEQTYKNMQLGLVSIKNLQLKDIFEISSQFQPDLILVQGRPEYYLPSFQLLPRRQDIFSDKLYLRQLIMESQDIKDRLLSDDLVDRFSCLLQDKDRTQDEKIYIQDTKGPIDDEVILMSAYFSAVNSKPIMFGDMPEQPWREWICNSHTLMELQELFKALSKNYPFYESMALSLEKIAYILKPQIFLNLRDRYLATLIEMLVAQMKYKKVVVLMGSMQNQAVWQLLSNGLLLRPSSLSNSSQSSPSNELTPMLQYLVGPPIKSPITKNVQGWQIIQKHIILDVIKHGADVVNIPMDDFVITNKIVDHYGILLNSYSKDNILKFRFDKILQYLSLMEEHKEEGNQLKKKFMLREAIRSQDQ